MADQPAKDPPSSAELLPLAEAVQRALDDLDQTIANLEHLASGFALARQPVKTLRWPKPGPPKAAGASAGLPPPVPAFPPDRVLEAWKAGGAAWLDHAPHREVRAAQLAVSDDRVGPQLVEDAGFLPALLRCLRPTQQQRVLTTALFRTFPPVTSVLDALASAPAVPPVPRWWSSRGSLSSMLDFLSAAVLEGDLSQPGDLDVPATAWRTGWAEALVAERAPETLEHVRAQILFARAGKDPSVGIMSPAIITALRRGLDLARQGGADRREMARLAVQQAGSPFGPDAEARWRPLGGGLQLVRQWLAGEIIKIVFEHLVPPDHSRAHMAPPRREFWSQYTGSVRRIWVAVTPAIRPQLEHPDIARLEMTMGHDFVICDLDGGPEQAIVWMQLDGPQGPVTVIEGNANTSIRIREGELEPRASRRQAGRRIEIDYSAQIVRGEFANCKVWRTAHHGGWEENTTNALLQHGIRRDSA